eukprot:gene37522-45571_t
MLLALSHAPLAVSLRAIRQPCSLISRPLSTTSCKVHSGSEWLGPDKLVATLSGDLQLRAVSCRELLQNIVSRQLLSEAAAQTLGETLTCALLLGSSLKGEETLQVSLVGRKEGGGEGIRSVVVTVDAHMRARGIVGNPSLFSPSSVKLSPLDLLGGQGQVQVLRSHPLWRHPQTGITILREGSVALNLALHIAESEQRRTFMCCEVAIDPAGRCLHALGLMAEALPGCSEDALEACIRNLQHVQSQGLRIAVDSCESKEDALDQLLDSCLLEENGNALLTSATDHECRWRKIPSFHCPCSQERALKALLLLSKTELEDMIKNGQELQLRCEFCARKFTVPPSSLESQT